MTPRCEESIPAYIWRKSILGRDNSTRVSPNVGKLRLLSNWKRPLGLGTHLKEEWKTLQREAGSGSWRTLWVIAITSTMQWTMESCGRGSKSGMISCILILKDYSDWYTEKRSLVYVSKCLYFTANIRWLNLSVTNGTSFSPLRNFHKGCLTYPGIWPHHHTTITSKYTGTLILGILGGPCVLTVDLE